MTFFAVTASIMAVSILLIYKLCRYFGLELKWISLVLCALFAFGVNGATILLSPFLTQGHYIRLTALVLVAAGMVTLVNEYLLKRDRKRQLATADGTVLTLEEEPETAEESASPAEPAKAEVLMAAADQEPGAKLSQRLLDAMKANQEEPAEMPAPEEETKAEAAAEPAETASMAEASAPEPAAEEAAAADEEPAAEEAEAVEPAAAEESTESIDSAEINAEDSEPAEKAETVEAAAEVEDAADSETADTNEREPDGPAEDAEEEIASTAEAVEEKASEASEAADDASEATQEPETAPETEAAPEASEAEEPADSDKSAAAPEESPLPEEAPAPQPETVPEEKPAPVLPAESKIIHMEPEAAEAAVAELGSLDEILDFAYSHKESDPDAAITAYQAAIDRYPEDSYAPFLIIELAGLYKERASYNEAINLYAESLGLPIIAGDDAMVQEFSKTLRYLGTVQDILSKHHALATPFSKLTPEILAEIEKEFARRQAK